MLPNFALNGSVLLAALILSLAVDCLAVIGNCPHMAELTSTLTCPICDHVEPEQMPTDACQWFYECKGCGEVLKPLPGDCCVFCSYGTIACPPIQDGGQCCA